MAKAQGKDRACQAPRRELARQLPSVSQPRGTKSTAPAARRPLGSGRASAKECGAARWTSTFYTPRPKGYTGYPVLSSRRGWKPTLRSTSHKPEEATRMRLPDRLLEGPRRREVARGVTAIPESARNSRQTAPPPANRNMRSFAFWRRKRATFEVECLALAA